MGTLQYQLTTNSPEQTQELGKRLGKLALPGDVFLLVGNLGAGKTCLTQGIAWGLAIEEYTASPTFVLVRELYGRLNLYHIDLYRLDHIDEIADLGLDDYLYGNGLCVIEWAEKGSSLLPQEHLLIEIGYVSDNERSFRFEPAGKRYRQLVSQLKGNKEN
jgi:tRNA threonylcarbamoyladenosine biosynthesis protein TsaE